MTETIYLDANATTPVLPVAARAALHAMECGFGNPSSTHALGLRAKELMERVRERAQVVLGAGSGRLLFVSGATEAIQTAVLSALCNIRDRRQRGETVGRRLVYGATEHKAVPQCLAHWNTVLGLNLELVALPVDSQGQHDLVALRGMVDDCALLCTMAANNETGVVTRLDPIADMLAQGGNRCLWLVDGVQALGKLSLELARRRIDYAAFSGHKLFAPKGIGLLYVRNGAPFTPLMVGGGQEDNLRSGTENLAGIAALGAVLQALEEGQTFRSPAQMAAMRERLAASLRSAFPGLVFNAPLDQTLPTTLNFSVPGRSSKDLLDVFDAAGIRVSAGSACSAAKAAPSHVLEAMGLPAWCAESAVRMSFGALATDAWIDQACARIRKCGAAWDAGARPGVEQVPAPSMATAVPSESGGTLEPSALGEFLQAHPGALLVDVREPVEQRAGGVAELLGQRAQPAPLSELDTHIAPWLVGNQTALVFICRSGARAERAAQYLRQRGHRQAWHLRGGLALQADQAAA